MHNLIVVQRLARGARNALIAAAVLLVVGLLFFSTPKLVAPSAPLTAGFHTVEVRGPWLGFFFRHLVRLRLDGPRLGDFDILVRSRLGYYRVDSGGAFLLPVYFRDQVSIQMNGPAAGAVMLTEARVERMMLPGSWVLLGLLGGLTLFFGWLAKEPFTQEKCLHALLLAGSSGVGLLMMAVGMQMGYGRVDRWEPWHLFPPNLDEAFEVVPNVTPGIPSGVVRFKTNSEGLRARERGTNWAQVFSVLCVGASTTEGLYLGEENHWPHLLEKRLEQSRGTNVWVGNAGHAGYSTARVVWVASNYVPRLNPQYLIVLTGFNEGIVPDQAPFADDLSDTEVGSLQMRLKQIALLRFLRKVLFKHASRSPNDVNMAIDTSWHEQERARLRARQTPPHERAWRGLDLSDFEKGLRRLYDIALRHGSTLILLTQPTLYRADLKPEEERLLWMIDNYSGRRRMELVNDRVRQVAKELSVKVVDLDRELPRTTEVFYDDAHFNVRGAQRVAELVFEQVFKNSTDGRAD
jgi:lysophospholipase L1-like esterase